MHQVLSHVPLSCALWDFLDRPRSLAFRESPWVVFYILVASLEFSAWRRKAEQIFMALIRPTAQPRSYACVSEAHAQSVKDCAYITPSTTLSYPSYVDLLLGNLVR